MKSTRSDIRFDLVVEARKAQVENALVLTHDAVVKSRTLENGPWRGVNESRFVVGP